MKEEVIISGLKLWDEEGFAGQEDEAFSPEETMYNAVERPCCSECEQLGMEEAGWCWGEVEGKGKEEDCG